MPWVRIDENFPDHPKLAKAGPLGMAMQVAALCYCNRQLTDGFVPRAVAKTLLDLEGLGMRMWSGELMGGGEDASWELIVGDLVEAGLWDEVDGGFRIHDFHDFQPTRDEVLTQRQERDRAKAAGGIARAAGAVRDQRGHFAPKSLAPAKSKKDNSLASDGTSDASSAPPALTSPDPDPVTVPKEQRSKPTSAGADLLWPVMVEHFAKGKSFDLTSKRRIKLRELWDEHLHDQPDSAACMGQVCVAIAAHLASFESKPLMWLPESSLVNPERREARFMEAMDPSLRKRRGSPVQERASEKADRTRRMLESHQAAQAEREQEIRADEGEEAGEVGEQIDRLANAWRFA